MSKEARGGDRRAADGAAGAHGVNTMSTSSRTLILPIQLLSKNDRDRLHRHARHKLRQDYLGIVGIKYPQKSGPPQHRQKATVTRIKGPRERDFDEQNIGAGSAIELIDAMTAAGFWLDDSPRWLTTRFEQGTSDKVKGPAVLVRIEPA